jgi:pentatricopeptide repeat protein
MKLKQVLEKIVADENLTDSSVNSVMRWVTENKATKYLPLFISAVQNSELKTSPVKGIGNCEIKICKLDGSDIFILLANFYSRNGLHDEAIALFEEMSKKGCNESTLLNDYGAALLNEMISKNQILGDKLIKARGLIFEAFKFDKKVVTNSLEYPAYKNLCFLRNIEARYYYDRNDNFTAFVLGWMSIEMTINRIWLQFISKGPGDISKNRIDRLMRWNVDPVIETLFLGKVHDIFLREKCNLDTLRRIRNSLLHGKIENPTPSDTDLCINVGYSLIPIFNQ